MKTHGGRSFLHGHLFGDNVHEYLAPCIYEGEGEMLAMGFFKSLVKAHGVQYFEPIGKTVQAAGIRKPNMLNPAHAWALKGVLWPYAKWLLGRKLLPPSRPQLPPLLGPLATHAEFAAHSLQHVAVEISDTMSKHQLALADRQCRMSELSQRVQDMVTMLCVSLYAGKHEDEVVRAAADILCQDLTRKLTGQRASDRYFRAATRLGEAIAEGGFRSISGLNPDEILMPYENK
jgi:hypothetical protein